MAQPRRRPLAWQGFVGLLLLLLVLPAATCNTPPVTDPAGGLSRGLQLDNVRPPDNRPIRMLSRDGTDLPLVSLEVRGTVEDPLAFTELHLEFENPEPRPLDATLSLRLPAKARVTRFAALIEGSWREAEVVERKPGALRPSLHEPAKLAIDPSPDGDQRFEVTLPNVPGRSVQRVIVSYTQTFDHIDMAYRVRLAGLHDIPRFTARVVVRSQPDPLLEVWAGNRLPEQLGMDEHGRRVLELRRFDWTATEDFVVPTSGLRRTGVRNGRKVAVRINPLSHDHAAPIEELTILFDTSASRAVGYRQQVERLAELLEALQPWTGNQLPLRLIAFDQGFETIYEGPLGAIDRGAFERLQARSALGASNLVSVLRHVSKLRGPKQSTGVLGPEAWTAVGDEDESPDGWDNGSKRVLLISDGMATAGVSERGQLLATVANLADADIGRVDVIADHGRRDAWTLRHLVRQLPGSGLVLDASDSPRQIVRRLLRTVHDDVKISVPGARWYYPEVVHGVQSDDEVLVFADVETVEAGLRVTVESHGKQTWVVPLVDVEEPLVGRALEQARVEFLVSTLEDKAEGQPLIARKQLWRRIVQSAKLNRVLGDYTRLSMLGDRDDYERAGLDPASLPDLLFAGPEGVQVRSRGLPNALAENDVPLARGRLPEFPSETLGIDQLLLLAQDEVSAGPSGLSSADADAVMAAGALVEPPLPALLPELEPPPDSPAA
ncbi:VIT domain-containing protein, partial [Enhygromyxa salina]|uniref:VIT domain-containing protein n=1 Tax=Enhygromyxa salina TaxID=215803 RepID=UPI0013FD0815